VGGAWELSLGGDSEFDMLTGERVWGTSSSSGMSSGWVAISMAAEPGGGAASPPWLSVAGCATGDLVYAGRSYGDIIKVQLRAAVAGQLKIFAFRNLVVTFSSPSLGTRVVTVPDGAAPVADTSTSNTGTALSAIQVNPGDDGYTRVLIEAEVLLAWSDPVPESVDAMIGSIFVFTASCSSS